MTALAELEHRKMLQVLVTLLEKPLHFRELNRRVGGSSNTLNKALKNLEKLNLVKEIEKDEFPFLRIIALTDKGVKVAELLKQIEKLISE